jgi:putative membrane protein
MNMVVSHWSANAVVLAAYAVVAAAHLLGMRGAATETRRQGQSGTASPVSEAVAFHLGLLMVLLAVVSPIGYWSTRFIWVRSAQDVLLAIGAPALIVLGAPWLPLSRGIRLSGRHHQHRSELDGNGTVGGAVAGESRPQAWRPVPILVAVAFSVIWWGWHVPVPFDAALHTPAVYAAEVATYLVAGVLLWLQLIGSRPYSPRLGPLHRVALVVGTAASCTVLGLVRAFGRGVAYPAYLGFQHHDLSVVADQQMGGAVLWVVALVPFSITAVALLIRWLNDEESQTLATGIDRLLKPPKPAWPSRPGLR